MKNQIEIINNENVGRAFTTPDNRFLKVETKLGTVMTICEQHQGYQVTMPIKPNPQTGSAVGVTGDYWDYVTYEELLKILQVRTQIIPNYYSVKDRMTVQFLTIDQAVSTHGNVLQYYEVKLPNDRDRVNNAIKVSAQNVACPVSLSFVEEMRDCVPPVTMKTGPYSLIQVGEISEHDEKTGEPLYETYMCMNQSAVDSDVADKRLQVGQWYFMGLKRQSK